MNCYPSTNRPLSGDRNWLEVCTPVPCPNPPVACVTKCKKKKKKCRCKTCLANVVPTGPGFGPGFGSGFGPSFGPGCAPGFGSCGPNPIVNFGVGRRAVTTWKINYLVSSIPNQAAHTDYNLINPWGIVVINAQLWVANGITDCITNYDLYGNQILGAISTRSASHNASYPTGIVANCEGGFSVSNGIITKSAQFLIASEHGTLHAYNPLVEALDSYIVVNQQLTGAVAAYKGLAIANNIVYLADFSQNKIDVFDSSYVRLLGFRFLDGETVDPIPIDYAPNNIVYIGCYLYVLWARRDPIINVHDLDGPGHGYISVFNLDGSFVRRFASRGVLNSPWAMIPAPCECGFPPGSFLVGNNGDGRINVFDCNGRYVGPLLNQSGLPIHIEGLWGLAPYYTEFSEIFFTAAPNENIIGILGSITKDQVINF